MVTAHLYLGLREAGDPGQVLTGADVGVRPCCKHPLQLQQLPSAEGGPLPPVGTQPTGMACRPGWGSSQDSLQEPPLQPQSQQTLKPLLPTPLQPSPSYLPHILPLPTLSPPDHLQGTRPLGWPWSRHSEEPDGHAKAVPTPLPSAWSFILLRRLAPPPGGARFSVQLEEG